MHPCRKKKLYAMMVMRSGMSYLINRRFFSYFEAEVLLNIKTRWSKVKSKLIEKEWVGELAGGSSWNHLA